MAYLKISEPSANQANSLKLYYDLKADVRHDGNYHSIRGLVQPDDPEVQEVARVLVQADDFVSAAQDFVDSFTTYRRQIGDYWATPAETMTARCPVCTSSADLVPLPQYEDSRQVHRCGFCGWQGLPVQAGDCDDKAILLVSLLRAGGIPAKDIYCAIGTWDGDGHMWVVQSDPSGEDRIIEATAPSSKPVRGNYRLYAIFNDKYTFAYPEGIREFCLKPVIEKEVAYA